MIARIIFALWILPAAPLVWAHDGINDKWYKSLKMQGTNSRCCTQLDCQPTEAEVRNDHWWARDPDGNWIESPDDAVVRDKGNPVGQPILCMIIAADEFTTDVFRQVLCFVPGGLS